MDTIDGKNVTINDVESLWTGCVFLFLQSACPQVNLLTLYRDLVKKAGLFKVIKQTLSDATGGSDGYEILKLHDADPLLGVEIKFMDKNVCRRFLESYSHSLVRQAFAQHAVSVLSGPEDYGINTQLKAGDQTLDNCFSDLELCLESIHLLQPVRLRDDEVSQLERQLQNLALGDREPTNTPRSQVPKLEVPTEPNNCFRFQKKLFDDRQLTSVDQHRFATNIGRDWKKVGRVLQKTCRALENPAIDNLAFEYEREGLYEQAYQLLSRFIQAEGKCARLGRLVKALEETRLTGIAEIMLDITPRE